ncbi:MAG: alanyl-tRNA editing protein [Holosporales bacterium]|jgi:alanyl-tRNA synthetase|nr:alanyl-tRNA editing protein [Holosporales bacterium]
MTELLYLTDTYLFQENARVVRQTEDYVVLDRTIFYPQGGGQPCDQGRITADGIEIFISSVRFVDEEVRHYGKITDQPLDDVTCKIDFNRRLLNAKYHTAGHLVAGCLENAHPQMIATKCHAFPGEAYVEFQGASDLQLQLIQELANQSIQQKIPTKVFEIDLSSFENKYYKLPYPVPTNKPFRVLQIGDYKPVPCGGTHLSNTDEIGSILIKKMKTKAGVLKISYEICEPH